MSTQSYAPDRQATSQQAAFCRPADENVERCLPVLHAVPPTLLVPSAFS